MEPLLALSARHATRDWGFSFASRINVDTLATVVALPVRVLASTRPYSIFDQIANKPAFVDFALQSFFTGLLLILVFSVQLDWLPMV